MNDETIKQAAELISLKWDNVIPRNEVKKKAQQLLKRKGNAIVVKELETHIKTISGNEKNKTVLIVVLILLIRNLDCAEEIKTLLCKNGLVNCLFGGIKTLLAGRTELFGISVKWNDDVYENKLKFLTQFQGEFRYWKFVELFEVVRIIFLSDPKKFDKLAKCDKSKLLIFNLASHHFNVIVSDELLEWLLISKNEMNRNIGFYLLTEKLSGSISNMQPQKFDMYFSEAQKNEQQKFYRKNKKILHAELIRVEKFLSQCDIKIKVSLLFNYVLSTNSHPIAFYNWLMEIENRKYLIEEIRNSKKLRTLADIDVVAQIISKIYIRNNNVKMTSKEPLCNAVVSTLISFVKNRRGIYQWTDKENACFSEICKLLTVRARKRLSGFLWKEIETLMICDIDKLLRHKTYLEDERKYQIILGMLSVVQDN